MKIALQRGQFLRVVNGAGSTLTAHGGAVWITEERNPRDVVLRSGQNLILRRSGVALVEAFDDATVFLEH